jgi:hypothetical protein
MAQLVVRAGNSHGHATSRKGAAVIRVAVVGCGYWGPNLDRNISEAPGT